MHQYGNCNNRAIAWPMIWFVHFAVHFLYSLAVSQKELGGISERNIMIPSKLGTFLKHWFLFAVWFLCFPFTHLRGCTSPRFFCFSLLCFFKSCGHCLFCRGWRMNCVLSSFCFASIRAFPKIYQLRWDLATVGFALRRYHLVAVGNIHGVEACTW